MGEYDKDLLISEQQLEIARLCRVMKNNKVILDRLEYRIMGIGQPLNDNNLKMNRDQLLWVRGIKEQIDKIEV